MKWLEKKSEKLAMWNIGITCFAKEFAGLSKNLIVFIKRAEA